MPMESTPAALEAVRSGAADFACVPIENSIEGGVLPTLDTLAAGAPLQVYAELTLDVAFSIVTRPGTGAGQGKTVAAFPVAGWPRTHRARRRCSRVPTPPPPPTSRPATPPPG